MCPKGPHLGPLQKVNTGLSPLVTLFITTAGAEFRYRDPVKRFYNAGYDLFHNRWLRFMHGIGGSKINFPVPDYSPTADNFLCAFLGGHLHPSFFGRGPIVV